MVHLIDKDALVAEIESLLDKGRYHEEYDCAYRDGNNSALYALKGKIDTLEVREANLNKELSYEDYKGFFEKYPNLSDDWGFEEAYTFAQYFFKLGLKAQKGE